MDFGLPPRMNLPKTPGKRCSTILRRARWPVDTWGCMKVENKFTTSLGYFYLVIDIICEKTIEITVYQYYYHYTKC